MEVVVEAEGIALLSLMPLARAHTGRYNRFSQLPARSFAMNRMRRFAWVGLTCLLTTVVAAAPQREKDPKDDSAKPKITLKAQPTISMAPSRVVLTAELVGGADDYEDFYCPTVQWDWGDGTQSESTLDCEPYEAGKSVIKRRFTVQHVFRTGAYKVMFRLKKRDRAIAAATVSIQVRPGLREGGM